ncbi:MAG: DUF6062 family protein [bacterium]
MDESIKNIKSQEFYKAYRDSDGLCISHLSKLLTLSRDKEINGIFIELTASKLKLLSDQLSEFIRKQDYRFKED